MQTEKLAELEIEQEDFLRKIFPQDMNPTTDAMICADLWQKIVEKAGEISQAIHEESCPQHSLAIGPIAVGDCRCIHQPDVTKWSVATYLARVAFKLVSPANTFPEGILEMADAYIKILHRRAEIPDIRHKASRFNIAVEAISLLVPFATYLRKLQETED